MTQTNPEQWALDLLADIIDIGGLGGPCSEADCVECGKVALKIQAAFAEREANAWKEADRQEALAKVYRQAQLTAEAKLCREVQNVKGWQKRAEYLETQLAALKDRTHG